MIASLLLGLITDLDDSGAGLLLAGTARQALDLSASRTHDAVSWIR